MSFLDPWDMQDLLQSCMHLDLTYYYSLHRLVKQILDHRSLTSTYYSFFQSWLRVTRDVLATNFLDISASSFCFFSSLSPLFLAKFRRGRNVCLPLFYNLKKLSEILNLVFTFMQILQNGFFDFSGRKFSNCFSRNLWDGIYKIWGKRKWLFQKRLIYKNYMWNSFVNL